MILSPPFSSAVWWNGTKLPLSSLWMRPGYSHLRFSLHLIQTAGLSDALPTSGLGEKLSRQMLGKP